VGRTVRLRRLEVQARVAEYLARMADVQPARIDVVVDEVGPVHA
jgi:phenylpyruvate tautomerase PptA (4-oxalocrotonate tautomerase family)